MSLLPDNPLECLKEAEEDIDIGFCGLQTGMETFVLYAVQKRLWQYIVTRTTKERCYYRYEDGNRVKAYGEASSGAKGGNTNGNVVYSPGLWGDSRISCGTPILRNPDSCFSWPEDGSVSCRSWKAARSPWIFTPRWNIIAHEQLALVLERCFASWD